MSDKELYSEVLGVLLALGTDYTSRLPKELVDFLVKECDTYKIPTINKNKRIEEQNVSADCRAFLTMFKLKYWCETQEERNELLNLLQANKNRLMEKLESATSTSEFMQILKNKK